MKTCPICHAVAFDDALVCFGCMHRYETTQESQVEPSADADAFFETVENAAPRIDSDASGNASAQCEAETVEELEFDSSGALDGIDEAMPVVDFEVPCRGVPGFVIRMTPAYEESGAIAWSCSVDLASA